jgi:hypothetical protein
LATYGAAVSVAALIGFFESEAKAEVPESLLLSLLAAPKTATAGAVAGGAGGSAVMLAEEAMRTMFLTKVKTVVVMLAVLVAMSAAALRVAYGEDAPKAAVTEDFKETLYPGGKIFPLVLYDVSPKYFAEVKEAGFNCVHMYSSGQDLVGAKKYLEEARKLGLYVLQNMPSGKMGESKEWWANWVKELSGYDNLAWWYPPEESHADKIAHICGAIRENDPKKRPAGAYVCWNNEKTLTKYKDMWDMMLKSSYPSYYKEPRVNVVSWMDNIRNAGICRNIAVAELFGKAGLPDGHQIRFDHYAALVMGSKGMCWYKWAHASETNPDALKEAKKFAWEISGNDNKTPLGRVILSDDIPQTVLTKVVSGPEKSPSTYWYSAEQDKDIQKSWPSIMTLEKKHDGHGYLFAVNTAEVYPGKSNYTDATVKAEFTKLPTSVKEVEVLFEERRIPVQNGAFQDTFKELDVHVYRFKSGGGRAVDEE